jgi:hypothetical protein
MQLRVTFRLCFFLLSLTALLTGCSEFLPNFEGVLGINGWTHEIQVNRVANEIQCELREFTKANRDYLDPEQSASVSLSLQVDESGSVTYLGIDLSKLGLASLANFVSAQNKVPSLQGKAQGKSTVSSQVDLSVPQTFKDQPVKAKYAVDPDTGKLKLVPASTIKGLERVDCSNPDKKLLTSLSLQTWLTKFFEKVYSDDARNPTTQACLSKVTLKTQFVVLLDVSAGVNPILGAPLILPISGTTFDVSPQFTHSLTLAFSLKKYPGDELCTKVPGAQPNRTI